jgi:hypothetical protein
MYLSVEILSISLVSIETETDLKFYYGSSYVIFSISDFPQYTALYDYLHFVFATTTTTTIYRSVH